MSRSIAIKYFLLWQTIIIIRHVSPLITPFSEIHFVWDGVPPVLSFLRGPQPIFTPGVINSLNYCAYAVGCTSSPKRVRKHRGIAKLSDPQNLTSTRSWIRKGFRIYLIPALIPEAPLWLNILGHESKCPIIYGDFQSPSNFLFVSIWYICSSASVHWHMLVCKPL